MQVKFVDINGVSTRYLFEGSGYPLLLLHGAGLLADSWLRNIPTLGQDFHVVAPDLLGHGFSGSGEHRNGPPQPHTVAHLCNLVDSLGINKFAVAGSSYGGLMAGLLYFAMPERVEKLIIVSSGSSFNTEEDSAVSLRESFKNGLSAITNPTFETCHARMSRIFYDPEKIPSELIMMQMTTYAMPGVREAYENRMNGMMELEAARPFRIRERLGQINVPTLVVLGKQDPRIKDYDKAVEVARELPKGTLVSFDKSGHLPHIEHPQKFNRLVKDFIKK